MTLSKSLLSFVSAISISTSALAQDRDLVWTAYGTTSTGFAQASAIAEALRQEKDVEVSIVPGSNDVARLTPLKTGRADFCVCGIGAYFAFEGTGVFGAPDQGPQPVRLILMSTGSLGLGLAASAKSEITDLKDLKGRRVAWVTGSDATNVNTAAFLAFAGLTWDDVDKIEFPNFKASVDGVINGQADAAFMTTSTPHAMRLAESPNGIHWPDLAGDDAEKSWGELLNIAPFFFPIEITNGAGIAETKSWKGAGYPYPLMLGKAESDEETVYNLTASIIGTFESYSTAMPQTVGWAMERQNFEWVIPYHNGAIKYFSEIGVWTEEMQAHNDRLIARSEVLQATWADYSADASEDTDAFASGWKVARAAALKTFEEQ